MEEMAQTYADNIIKKSGWHFKKFPAKWKAQKSTRTLKHHNNPIVISFGKAWTIEVIVVINLERSKQHLCCWDMCKCDFAMRVESGGPPETGDLINTPRRARGPLKSHLCVIGLIKTRNALHVTPRSRASLQHHTTSHLTALLIHH